MIDAVADIQQILEDWAADLTLWPDTPQAQEIAQGGILDRPSYPAEAGGEVRTISGRPQLTMRDAHAAQLSQGDEILVHAAPELAVAEGRFRVAAVLPDGTGLSLVELHNA